MLPIIIICLLSCLLMIGFIIFYPTLKIKNIHISTYWLIILLGAFLLVILGYINFNDIYKGLSSHNAVNPIKILILFLSMTFISMFLDEENFFAYIANRVLKHSNSSQTKLFIFIFITVSILTIFTSNDIIILTFTPFLCYFAKHSKISPIPYLFAEFVAANTSSMFLIIGNPTNIYLATSYNLDFTDYFLTMAIPTLIGSCVAFLLLYVIFRKKLQEPIIPSIEDVHIKDVPALIIGLTMLVLCTIFLVISSYISMPMYLIALVFMLLLVIIIAMYNLITKKSFKSLFGTFKRLPYEIVPFVISMFVFVMCLDKYEITTKIASLLVKYNQVFSFGITSFLTANVINNIPMSVLFSSILANGGQVKGVYAAIIGSNLGAYLTPLGALAGIMWLNIVKKQGIDFNFIKFIKYGVLVSLPTLLVTLLVLFLVF